MYPNDVATLPQFSGRERVVGAWLPDDAGEEVDARKAAWVLMGRCTTHDAVRIISIRVSPFRIGREQGLDLAIPSPTVSRVHAEIRVSGSELQVRDLSSSNGTFVNGQRIRGTAIIESDALLEFANVPFRVCLQSGRS